jgi:hypothetical protein
MTGFWLDGGGSEYNIHRKEVFQNICPVCDFEEVKEKIRNKYNGDIKVLIPDARQFENSISYENAKELIKSNPKINYIIVFGTGYGLTEEFIQTADYILDPIYGPMNYNHLSVRSAAAIILDRLFGR